MKDCPFAYYIHCLVHQLQFALIIAFEDVLDVCFFFFQALGSIVNVLSSSIKHIFELKSICEADIASREVQIGTGANQI